MSYEAMLQNHLDGVIIGIKQLKEENARLRATIRADEHEIRKEFEAELDYYKEAFNRSWMTLSPLEDERLRNFRDRHYQLHKKDNGFISHIFGTGIGTCYTIECPICNEKEDITDTGNW